MASAATTSAARHDLRSASASSSTGTDRDLALSGSGTDAVPYAVSGIGSLIVGAGAVYAARRWSA
ncbi:hypothetical protein GXW82_29060 [Streptacidiphilus sp. 4-A2]|nr:hypothetical protein [Streptacidiphilus sp. 4-A2]